MEYERNEDGSLKLDAAGNPIPKPPKEDPKDPPKPPAKKDQVDPELEGLDEKTKKYILDLRKENAGYRTKAKAAEESLKSVKGALGLTEDQESPEEKVKSLAAQVEAQQLNSAIMQNALEHEVPKEGLKYFRHLIKEELETLPEGQELSEAKIAELALEAKSKAIKPKADSSVNGGKGSGTPPPADGKGEMTPEQFAALGMAEKSKIYTENEELYKRLWTAATEKKLIK